MESITAKDYSIHFNENAYTKLNQYVKEQNPSLIIVLVDTNTQIHCLNKFLSRLETDVKIEVIEISDGEEYKTIETCVSVWQTLSDMGADRKSLMINLGGGVITDLGGFVACTFRRGIPYINVPTSLLAMVDASVGGKTGVDLGVLKNQIGIIKSGDLVLVDTSFLETLPPNHYKSGLSEMLKHGLIQDRDYWKEMQDITELNLDEIDKLIHRSIEIKYNIVNQDPYENGLRKALNYGHTLGHAIESFYLEKTPDDALLHGEAIAIGMIMESYISHKLLKFPEINLKEIATVFMGVFEKKSIDIQDQEDIMHLLKFDKKNEHGNINFVLLQDIGEPVIDRQVENALIFEAFEYYNTLI